MHSIFYQAVRKELNSISRGIPFADIRVFITGLVNPEVTGLIGPGVVVHLPSFFEEFDTLRGKGRDRRGRSPHYTTEFFVVGLDCTGRLFISDRAHLVFDFHQIVDGLKEVELGGSSYVLRILSSYSRKQKKAYPGLQHWHDQERDRPRLLCKSLALRLARAPPV